MGNMYFNCPSSCMLFGHFLFPLRVSCLSFQAHTTFSWLSTLSSLILVRQPFDRVDDLDLLESFGLLREGYMFANLSSFSQFLLDLMGILGSFHFGDHSQSFSRFDPFLSKDPSTTTPIIDLHFLKFNSNASFFAFDSSLGIGGLFLYFFQLHYHSFCEIYYCHLYCLCKISGHKEDFFSCSDLILGSHLL